MMARGAPFTASKVRRMMWSRHWVSTWMVTSSGMRSSSMSLRRNSYSVSDAAGKPTSISLKPILHQHVVELQLLLQAHGDHQTLVAVPQVHAAPGGGGLDVVLLRPLVHVPRLHRRGIVADLIFRRVHPVKVLLLGFRLWKEGNKKSHLSKDHQSLRDGSKNAVPAVPLSLPGDPATLYDRPLLKQANRVCMITDSGRPHLKATPLSTAAQGPVTQFPPHRLAPPGGSLKQALELPSPLHRI